MSGFGGFGVGVGDIVLVSTLCWTIYKACSAGRNGAPAAISNLANELWSLSSALDQLAAASSKPGSIFESSGVQETTAKMILSCRVYLEDLQTVLQRYGIFSQPTPSSPGLAKIHESRIDPSIDT